MIKTFRTHLPILETSITVDLDDTQLSWLVEKMSKRGIPLHWNPNTERLEIQVVLLLVDIERVAILVLEETRNVVISARNQNGGGGNVDISIKNLRAGRNVIISGGDANITD